MAILSSGRIATTIEARPYIDPAKADVAKLSDAKALVAAHDAWYSPRLAAMTSEQLHAYIERQDAELQRVTTEYSRYKRPGYAKHIKTRTESGLETSMSVAQERLGCARLALRLMEVQ